MGSSTVGLAPGLSRKLKKVLECRTDSPNLLSSLNTLSSFYTENTPQSRRNLRYTIETRTLDINREFLRASDPAQRALDRVVEKEVLLGEDLGVLAVAEGDPTAPLLDHLLHLLEPPFSEHLQIIEVKAIQCLDCPLSTSSLSLLLKLVKFLH